MNVAELKEQFKKLEKKFYSEKALCSIVSLYQQDDLRTDYLHSLVKRIIGLTLNDFELRNITRYNQDRLKAISDLRKIIGTMEGRDLTDDEKRGLTSSSVEIYLFSRGDRKQVIDCLKKADPSFSEDLNDVGILEKYQKLAKEITKEQVETIINTVYNSMPNVEKFAYNRSPSISFVERYTGSNIHGTSSQVS